MATDISISVNRTTFVPWREQLFADISTPHVSCYRCGNPNISDVFQSLRPTQHCAQGAHVNKCHHLYFTTWHTFPSMCTRTETNAHIQPYNPHPKLAIILNPSPAWVIPNNPGLILVNSGHSSDGFHPETTETGLGLVRWWRLRLSAALTDIIGWAVTERQEKQAQVFRGSSKYVRLDPHHVTPQP